MINTTRIKDIREDKDIPQKEMAKILNVNRSTYSMWEIGLSLMPLYKLCEFSKYFNLSIDYILGLSNDRSLSGIKEFNYETLGENIKNIRTNLHISQKTIAKKLNVTQAYIVRWEKGITKISISNLYELSKIFNVTLMDICQRKTKQVLLPV